MKRRNIKLATVLAAVTMSMAMVGCGSDEQNTPAETPAVEAETPEVTPEAEAEVEPETEAPQEENTAVEEDTITVAEGPLGLDYAADPEAYVGKWVLVNAYTAADGIIDVEADACYMDIEISIDSNKLVDEAAYIHADATNLKGTMSFSHDGIDVEEYSCTGNWSDWTTVDVQGEGNASFSGAIKFKVRDDDEGLFFNVLSGVEVEDMELFDVLGINAEGQLILGYSEDHIERDGSAEWEYAYIFNKAE